MTAADKKLMLYAIRRAIELDASFEPLDRERLATIRRLERLEKKLMAEKPAPSPR